MSRRTAFLLIAAAGAAADLATKAWAFAAVPPDGWIDVVPGWLRWRLSYNPGIVWGLFQEWPHVFTVLSAIAVPVIAAIFWKTRGPGRIFTSALGLILAGTLGNLHDRIVFGQVRDFIDVHIINYPIFNVADSMICVGVGLLIVESLFFAPPKKDDASEFEKKSRRTLQGGV